MNKADPELIAECLQGRTEAFGTLVLRYQDRLYHALLGMLGSADDARDVAQEAFVNAFEKLSTFRGNSAFYSWLFRIALNSAVNQQRKQRRATVSIDTGREHSGLEPTDHRPDSQPTFSLEQSESQAQLWSALREMPEDYRTVLILKELDGLKYEEIASIVDCPIGTVRSRIFRARAELKNRLREQLQSDP